MKKLFFVLVLSVTILVACSREGKVKESTSISVLESTESKVETSTSESRGLIPESPQYTIDDVLRRANYELEVPFSKDQLIEVLLQSYEEELVLEAIEELDIDWKEQALRYVVSLKESNSSLVESEEATRSTLETYQFTEDEISYALEKSR